MQQHFKPLPTFVPTVEELSVEEEAIQAGETSEHLAAADDAADEASHLADVANAADDTILVVSLIPELGDPEAQLVGAVADMAVAGTDTDPSDVLPITPSGEGVIATEGILETLKSIWVKICEIIAKMWKYVTDFYDNTFGYLERLKKMLTAQHDVIKEIGLLKADSVKNKSLTILSWTGAFHQGGRALQPSQIDDGLKKLSQLIGSLYKHAPAAVINLGKSIEAGFKSFNPDSVPKGLGYTPTPAASTEALDHPVKMLSSFAESLGKSFGEYTHCFSDITKMSEGKDGIVISSGPMMGNFHIELAIPNKLSELQNSPLDLFSALTKVRPEIKTDGQAQVHGFVFPLQDVSMYATFLNNIEQCIDLILDFKKGKVAADLKAQGEAIRKAADATMAKLKEGNAKEVSDMVRRMLPLNVAYANWSKEPMTGSINMAIKTYRSIADMCVQGLAHYKKNHKPETKETAKPEGEPAAA